jgi:hypothetical protein
MKHLKTFNESIDNNVKFCPECGTKLAKVAAFCADCGLKQDDNSESFTISGKIETSYPNGQKTPNFILSSMNKTISGTVIIFDKSINKYDIPVGKEVNITGTTENGLSPKFDNPIIVHKKEDVVLK